MEIQEENLAFTLKLRDVGDFTAPDGWKVILSYDDPAQGLFSIMFYRTTFGSYRALLRFKHTDGDELSQNFSKLYDCLTTILINFPPKEDQIIVVYDT